jgi:hypothetical protein
MVARVNAEFNELAKPAVGFQRGGVRGIGDILRDVLAKYELPAETGERTRSDRVAAEQRVAS